ncbi:hypothetical protein ABIE83_005408 [Bradyrhizobium diazoefficiens]
MTVKLLRAIALDPSDTFVFDAAAEPGEWAVSGAFRFCDQDPATLSGKARAAFRSGFLGVQSWGWSTLVQIVPATESDCRALIELLAGQLIDRFGAPRSGNRADGRRRGGRLRAVALHASDQFAHCRPPLGERRRSPRVVPQAAAAARAGARQGVLVHGSRG